MISFIVLHYKNINDTIECIRSILKQKTNKKISIVVVDNDTLNDFDEKKLKKFDVDLIKLDSNLGFAKANNIGCKHAINKYNPDFLCVINNDTVIDQLNFIDKIYECYKKYSFDILGPKIITDGGDSVNPFPVYKSVEQIDAAIKKSELLIKIYSNFVLSFLLNLYFKTKLFFKIPIHLKNGECLEKKIALHGCALIFSKKYYDLYDYVFYNDTFLYHEEEFLYQRILRDNLVSVYDPDIEIFHKEGASLNNNFKNQERKKMIFRNTEIIKSLQLLKKNIEENDYEEKK